MSNSQIDFLVRCKALGLENGKLSDWLDEIEALRAENEALKQQVEQDKRDAESWRAYKKRKDEVIAAGMGNKVLRDAAAPKEK